MIYPMITYHSLDSLTTTDVHSKTLIEISFQTKLATCSLFIHVDAFKVQKIGGKKTIGKHLLLYDSVQLWRY